MLIIVLLIFVWLLDMNSIIEFSFVSFYDCFTFACFGLRWWLVVEYGWFCLIACMFLGFFMRLFCLIELLAFCLAVVFTIAVGLF